MKKIEGQLRYAAEQHADGGAASGSRPPEAERDVALAALAERRHQQREAGRREERPAETFDRAEADERARRPGEAAEGGAEREQHDAGNEDPAPAEEIGEAAAEEQEAAEDDGVRADHPLEARLREMQVGLDRRERDVHDRHVENDHELGGDDEGQSGPTGRLAEATDRGLSHQAPS